MKFLILVCFVGFATLEKVNKPFYDLRDAESLFEKFEKDFNKHYKSDLDKGIHFEAFKKSLEDINMLNEQQPTITFDINSFADETADEFKEHLEMLSRNYPDLMTMKPPGFPNWSRRL
ncbi:cathepsin propeptide inhibitor domain (I29) domain-containing protein [Phthorimaea operculella]|nr:cathepsin propeptide inhibitor domain (I29) domain-containing protein [Phthorimaea operculella]